MLSSEYSTDQEENMEDFDFFFCCCFVLMTNAGALEGSCFLKSCPVIIIRIIVVKNFSQYAYKEKTHASLLFTTVSWLYCE